MTFAKPTLSLQHTAPTAGEEKAGHANNRLLGHNPRMFLRSGSGLIVQSNNLGRYMSALGQKQTLQHVRIMSALPPESGHRLAAPSCPLCVAICHCFTQP